MNITIDDDEYGEYTTTLTSDRELAQYVSVALGDFAGDFDADAIVTALINHPEDKVTHDDFWRIVEDHDISLD